MKHPYITLAWVQQFLFTKTTTRQKHVMADILFADHLFEAARMLLPTRDTVFAHVVQCVMCASVRKMQRKQGNPRPTDVERFGALEMVVAAWSATHRAMIEISSRNMYPLLQECWF